VDRTKWLIALGIATVALLGMTLVDKQSEQDCRDGSLAFLKEQPSASEMTITNVSGESCDGFLPW
jgi:hypothetical protein